MSRRPCWHSSGSAATATPAGWRGCYQPPKSCRCGPRASMWSRRSTACTTSTLPASWPLPPGCCGPAASCSSTPAPLSRTRARSGAATFQASPSTSSACTARPRSGTPSGGPAGSPWWQHSPSGTRARARPGGSGPRPRGATTRPSPSTRRWSCAQPSRSFWPACPARRSPGWTSTCWSSSAGAAATGWSPLLPPREETCTQLSYVRTSQQ
jgi:hypothetical protein